MAKDSAVRFTLGQGGIDHGAKRSEAGERCGFDHGGGGEGARKFEGEGAELLVEARAPPGFHQVARLQQAAGVLSGAALDDPGVTPLLFGQQR